MTLTRAVKAETWVNQMDRLFRLRTDQIVSAKKAEIDNAVEYAIERLAPGSRTMKLSDFMRSSTMTMQDMNCLIFPSNYRAVESKAGPKKSGCCQTTPPRKRVTQEHQTQTPVYTTHKRSRAEMENAELVSKIKNQLAVEPQHVILPATGEYMDMPPNKKHQIVNILNAIVSTYEDINATLDEEN